jgi:hypothetical protein
MSFSGITDIDNQILLSLTLDDLRYFCQSNQYINQLCKTNIDLNKKFKMIDDKIDYIFSIITYRDESGIILQPFKIDDRYDTFVTIMLKCHFTFTIPGQVDEDDDNNVGVRNYYIQNIWIFENDGYYTITSDLTRYFYGYKESYLMYATKSQLKEFLLQVYFNNLLLNL